MAFQEEFEYLSFRCCYCGFLNPSRKKRPSGPKFETKQSPSITLTTQSSDSDVSSESDGGSKPIITELRSESPVTTEKSSDFEKLSDGENRDSDEVVAPVQAKSPKNQTKDSGYSPIQVQDCGDSPTSQLEPHENPLGLNPFESDEFGDSGNPFNAVTEQEVSGTPMEYEIFEAHELAGPNSEMINTQETKED